MIIEKLIESAIVAKLAALDLPDVTVSGFWQPAQSGAPKGRESAASAAIGVVVAPRAYETFTSAKAQLRGVVTLTVRRDACPTGAELAAFAEPVFALLETWQRSLPDVKADLTPTDANLSPLFVPHGFRLDGGDPSTDPKNTVWIISQTFTLRGVIS